MTINKDIIGLKAKELLEEGIKKQEIYEKLSLEFDNRKEIAEIVRYIPYEEKLKKIKIINTSYLLLLVLVTLLTVTKITLGVIWLLWLIYVVATKKFRLYYWNSILGATCFITGVFLTIYGYVNGNTLPVLMILMSLGVSIIFIVFGLYIPYKVTPPYEEIKELQTSSNGARRIVLKHRFNE
ncbi:MAG: hypothetical protein AB7S48_17110 [Bacteroidales bacterium]